MRTGAPPLPIGVILAGGRGQRFGGTDKSFVELQGRPLIGHVIGRMAAQVRELLVSTNSADSRYQEFGLRLCVDCPRSTPATGPLVGVTSVFRALRESVLSVPVDTPFLPLDLGRHLSIALSSTNAPVAYAATTERDHPIIALWGSRSHDPVQRLFDRRPNISLHGLMAALHAERVIFTTPCDPFFNINCVHDLETAERIALLALNRALHL